MLLKQYIYSMLYVALGGWLSIWLWSLLGGLFPDAFSERILQVLLSKWGEWSVLLLFLPLHLLGPIIGGYIFLKISRRDFSTFESPELWWHVIFFSLVTGFAIDWAIFTFVDNVGSGIFTILGFGMGVILTIVAYVTKPKRSALEN